MAGHQSVISEIVTHLERQELLETGGRPRRPAADRSMLADRAGTLRRLRRDREVLSVEMLAGAMARLPAGQAEDRHRRPPALVDLATPHRNTRIDP